MISVTHFMDRDGKMLGRRLAAPLLLHAVPRAAGRTCSRWSATGSRDVDDRRARPQPAPQEVERGAPPCCRAHSSAFWRIDPPAERPFQPRLPDARRLRRRRDLLGRLQHRAGSSPTPRRSAPPATRCATTCSSGAEAHHPLHQPLGRARDLPRLPRAARLDRQDRAQDAGLEGSLGQDLRHHRHAREVPRHAARARRARMGAAEGQRLARMPQLPRLRRRWTSPGRARAREHALARFWSAGEKTCIDCHKGIAHRLPDIPPGQVSPTRRDR